MPNAKEKKIEGREVCEEGGLTILGCLGQASQKMVTFEQKPEGDERTSCVAIWRKCFLGRKKDESKGPEIGTCQDLEGAARSV